MAVKKEVSVKKEIKKEAVKPVAAKKEIVGKKIAVIRIAGHVRLKNEIVDTLKMLNLNKKNSCIVILENPSMMGMIKKVKDRVTWGEIDEETYKLLKEKRDKGEKYFALNPPRGGYARKGTKLPFKMGGALGYRKDKINDLIRRMI
jgi:large subunit ribosomal protein L30